MLTAAELEAATLSRWCVVRELLRYRADAKCFVAQCMADREIQFILHHMWRRPPCPSSLRAQEFNLAVVRHPGLFQQVRFFFFDVGHCRDEFRLSLQFDPARDGGWATSDDSCPSDFFVAEFWDAWRSVLLNNNNNHNNINNVNNINLAAAGGGDPCSDEGFHDCVHLQVPSLSRRFTSVHVGSRRLTSPLVPGRLGRAVRSEALRLRVRRQPRLLAAPQLSPPHARLNHPTRWFNPSGSPCRPCVGRASCTLFVIEPIHF